MFTRFKGTVTIMDLIEVLDDITNVQCPTLYISMTVDAVI